MGMARRPLGNGTLQFKAMLSPEPLMGPSGYPLAARQRRDRQRPRPADRPPAPARFLHGAVGVALAGHRAKEQRVPLCRPSRRAGVRAAGVHAPRGDHGFARGADQPPLARFDAHQLRRGYAGVVLDRVKLEVSRFNGREPDQRRWNIEAGPLDSTAVRVSWNPTAELALQGSWGHFVDPEQLEPGVNQKRLSASALYARRSRPAGSSRGRSPGAVKLRAGTVTMRSPPRRRSSIRAGRSSGAAR